MNIYNNFLHTDLSIQLQIALLVFILTTLQYFIFLIKNELRMMLFALLQILFGLFLNRISEYGYSIQVHFFMYILPSCLLALLVHLVVMVIPNDPKPKRRTNPWNIYLEFLTKGGGKIINYNPFNGIFVVAGPGSGKTRWFIKPAIVQFAKYSLPGVVYDYKRMDITETVYTHYKDNKIPVKVIDFVDPQLTHQVNPLDPALMTSPAYAGEMAEILFANSQEGDAKDDPFFVPAAVSILAGVIWKLREDIPDKCNLPYVVSICLHEDYKAIANFIRSNNQASLMGSAFLQVINAEKTVTAILATLSTKLRKYALPEVFYTLSGNDFSLDLNNSNCPSIMCINNYKPLEKSLSPIISLIISVALKHMNNPGKLPSCVVIEEGSTIRLSDFENVPATGRENGIISVFVLQDKGQAEKKYGKIGSENIIRNCMMHVYGLCRSSVVSKEYSEMMGQQEKYYVSHTSGTNHSSSTTSVRTENVYKPQTFTELGVGEFMGLIAEGNVKKFNKVFQPYILNDIPAPIVHKINPLQVKAHFNYILDDAKALLNIL